MNAIANKAEWKYGTEVTCREEQTELTNKKDSHLGKDFITCDNKGPLHITTIQSEVYTSDSDLNPHEMEISPCAQEPSSFIFLDQACRSPQDHSSPNPSDCSQNSPACNNTPHDTEISESDKGLVQGGVVPDVMSYKLEICPLIEMGEECLSLPHCKYSHSQQEQLRAKRLLVSILHKPYFLKGA